MDVESVNLLVGTHTGQAGDGEIKQEVHFFGDEGGPAALAERAGGS